MLSIADLKRLTGKKIEPLATVLWLLRDDVSVTIPAGLEGAVFGLTLDNAIDWNGSGYRAYDWPLYPLSSAQLFKWNTLNQKISGALLSGLGDVDPSTLEKMMKSSEEDANENAFEPGNIKVLISGAESAEVIRLWQEEMIEIALAVPLGSSALLQSIRLLDDDGIAIDAFTSAFAQISAALAPKKPIEAKTMKGQKKP